MNYGRHNSRGSVLMLVVLVGGILSLVVAITYRVAQNKQKVRERERHSQVIKGIYDSIAGRITDDAVVTSANQGILVDWPNHYYGYPLWQMIHKCMVNWPFTNDCVPGNANSTTPFFLFVRNSGLTYSRVSTILSKWSKPNNAYKLGFDLQGKFIANCAPASVKCPYAIEARFWGKCPKLNPTDDESARPLSCRRAEEFNISIQVYVRDRSAFRDTVPKISSYPTNAMLAQNSQGFVFSFRGDQILRAEDSQNRDQDYAFGDVRNQNYKGEVCPDHAYVTGVGSDGRIKCACQLGYVDTDASPIKLNCEAQSKCPDGKLLMGLKPDGTLNCMDPTLLSDEYDCRTLIVERRGQVNCAAGEKISAAKIIENECYVIKRGVDPDFPTDPGLTANEIVDCGPIEISCCKRRD